MSNTFKSYIGFNDDSNQFENNSGNDSLIETLTPRLLSGEVLIAEAQNVLLFAPVTEQKQGKSGTLGVTNFKLSFVTGVLEDSNNVEFQQNYLLGEYDVCLSNIDIVYQSTGDKKKKLLPGSNVSGKIKGLHILCKNMKVLTFSFKFSPIGQGKTVTNAILHHAFPKRHQLLFAYDYKEQYYKCQDHVCYFRDLSSWENELTRTDCFGWRVSSANQHYHLSTSLPEWLVVPSSLLDWQMSDAARHFRGNRPPIWTWGNRYGAALVRMADLQPNITDRLQENVMLENVRKSHPKRKEPLLMDLARELPSLRDLQLSFNKLRELCAPENLRQFWLQDGHYFSHLESTRWLHIVNICITKALEAAETLMSQHMSVVLQEGEGRDSSALVASLCQLLCDPLSRTITGFQTLIQKEWISLGHPFCTRLGHVRSQEGNFNEAPIFLLFLDCVWQLTEQLPNAFEFTEIYLISLWDTAHISIFETFLFDTERERILAENDKSNPLILRSAWDWGEQFQEKDKALFKNPLYNTSSDNDIYLEVKAGIANLSVWHQCYHRWLPLLDVRGGGTPQRDLTIRHLLSSPNQGPLQLPILSHLSSFFPFCRGGASLISSSLNLDGSFLINDNPIDSQSLLNAPD